MDFLGPEISSEPMTSLSGYYFSSNYYCFFQLSFTYTNETETTAEKEAPEDNPNSTSSNITKVLYVDFSANLG